MFFQPQTYRFSGDPVSQALAAKTHQTGMQAQSNLYASQLNAGAQRAQAEAMLKAAQAQANAQRDAARYGAQATMGAAASQAGGMIGAGRMNAFGNLAGAIASDRGNWYGANAMAEAARQNAASNIGTASLSAYGNAANNAMQSWAANQTAYNRSAADMHAANQQAMAGYGASRNSSLASLGGMAAMSGMFPGSPPSSGFNATGVNGPIASGNFGGGGGMPGRGAQPFLDTLRRDIVGRDGDVARQADLGRQQIDSGYYSSRFAPQQMLNQALGGLRSLGRDGYNVSTAGMNQFYGAMQNPAARPDFSGILRGLGAAPNVNYRPQMV